jgi:hypothetical protein
MLATLAVAPLAGCGTATRSHALGREARAHATPRDDWSAATWEDRHDTMTFLVLPNMARLFQRFDGSRYPEMTCRTCHGADAEAMQYKMPHGLRALDPAHLPSANAPNPDEARVAKFMIEQVTPQMAELLGLAVYDPNNRRGFSCFACHPRQGAVP